MSAGMRLYDLKLITRAYEVAGLRARTIVSERECVRDDTDPRRAII